ncbi:MAG: tRNA dihydrouridine synthase DusB [bacterium]|nr:tRNA dihydrouridine synthase DusB [bacterium]
MAVLPPRGVKPSYQFPRVMLAPVAGYTDRPTRQIAREKGCSLTFSELISARGIYEFNQKTQDMLDECRDEHPLIFQIFGAEPEIMYDAVRRVEDLGVDGVNLNLGCPVKKVFKTRSGCGLTLYPVHLVHVIRAMRKATNLHLSVKIRAGVNHKSLIYKMIGDIAQGEGCDGIIIHARTRLMGFGGQANWDWIADLKDYLDIPVIGNGDVIDPESAKRMIDETACDGVMIARGAYGNPWLFRRIEHYLDTGELLPEPAPEERIATLMRHLRLAVEWKGERKACFEMRKHISWYVRGLPCVRVMRDKVNQCETLQGMLDCIREWSESTDWDAYFAKLAAQGHETGDSLPPHRSVSLRVA